MKIFLNNHLHTILFAIRLLLYCTLLLVPFYLPKEIIPIAYAKQNMILFFVLVPLQMFIGYWVRNENRPIYLPFIASTLASIAFFLISTSHGWLDLALFLSVGFIAYKATLSLFHGVLSWGTILIEQGFFAIIYLKLLNFTRSNPQVSQDYPWVIKFLFFLFLASFFIHCILIYMIRYKNVRLLMKESLLLLLVIFPAIAILSISLGLNYFKHEVSFNNLFEKPPEKPRDLDPSPSAPPNKKQPQTPHFPYPRQPQPEPKLQSIPAKDWDKFQSDSHQKVTMVIASEVDELYHASEYLGKLDGILGFQPTPTNMQRLNSLSRLFIVDTWSDLLEGQDTKRDMTEMHYVSTRSKRYIPYRPFEINPTVSNIIYHPFRYVYTAKSRISTSTPFDWLLSDELTAEDKEKYNYYLELPLDPESLALFREMADQAIEKYKKDTKLNRKLVYYDKMLAIVQFFSSYNYKALSNARINLQVLRDFNTKTKIGDCDHFAHTAALLGRTLDIPSRVVTGVVMSKQGQSKAHFRAIKELRKALPALQEHDVDDLYMITEADGHAWVQYWFPEYGWIDFETTTHAQHVNDGEKDPWDRDILIPQIDPEKNPFLQEKKFPWKFLIVFFTFFASVILIGLYSYNFTRLIYYRLLIRSPQIEKKSMRAILLLVLFHFAREGYLLKQSSATIKEYAKSVYAQSSEIKKDINNKLFASIWLMQRSDNEKFQEFAKLYTELYFNPNLAPERKEEFWSRLISLYKGFLRYKRKGIAATLYRIFTLRTLYY